MEIPIKQSKHPSGSGIQKIYRFKNGYGASVVRFKLPLFSFTESVRYGSYTNNEGEWELAVIKFDSENSDKFGLVYNTPITDDVLGHLTDEQVEEVLQKIKQLK